MEYYISTDNKLYRHLLRHVMFINDLRLEGIPVKNVCLFQYEKDKKKLWIKGNIDKIMKSVIFNNKYPDLSTEESMNYYAKHLREHYNYSI